MPSSTMLNEADESTYILLLLILVEKYSIFHKYDVICRFFTDGLYSIEEISFYYWVSEDFYHKYVK